MRYRHNGAQPVYAPNSFSGPHADHGLQDPSWFVDGEIVRSAYTPHREDDDFVQPRTLWEQVLSATDQQHMVGNLVVAGTADVVADMRDAPPGTALRVEGLVEPGSRIYYLRSVVREGTNPR